MSRARLQLQVPNVAQSDDTRPKKYLYVVDYWPNARKDPSPLPPDGGARDGESMSASLTPMARLVLNYVRGRVVRGEIKRNTAARQRSILIAFADAYGRRPVNILGRKHIEQWLEQRQDLSAASRRNEFQAVRQFTRWLTLEKMIKTDPCARMKAPKVPRSVPRAMPATDIDRLLEALPDNRARLIISLMLNMGLRRGEVLSLQTGDYDATARTMTVVGKGGHTRLLPVPDEVAHHLRAYLGERGTSAGPMILKLDGHGGISDSRMGQLVRGWMEDAGVKHRAGDGRAAHSLRHTLATNVVAVEPDLRVVQQILGHVSLTSTQIYLAAADLPRVRSAMERAS